jgi:hypothetical protein
LFAGYVFVAAIYWLYEFSSGKQSEPETQKRSLANFLLKQLLMVALLYTAWQLARPVQTAMWYYTIEERFLAGNGLYGWWQRQGTKVLLIASAYSFVIDGGTRVVRGILDKFPGLYRKAMASQLTKGDAEEESENENAGEWIGILERIITLTFVLTGNFTAIAFALTAKSIARFKELENKDFAEYYLLGTAGSLIAAVAAGMVVKIVLDL